MLEEERKLLAWVSPKGNGVGLAVSLEDQISKTIGLFSFRKSVFPGKYPPIASLCDINLASSVLGIDEEENRELHHSGNRFLFRLAPHLSPCSA